MLTNIHMKIFYLQQNFWKYFFFSRQSLGFKSITFNGVIALFEKLKAYILTRGQQRIPPWNMVVLTFVFNYWVRILKLFKKNWNGQIKKENLQPISIFYIAYINITEIWYWKNLTVRTEVGMYLLYLMIYFIQNYPAYYKQDGLMSIKTPRHIHIRSYNNPTKLLQICILRLMKPLSTGKLFVFLCYFLDEVACLTADYL